MKQAVLLILLLLALVNPSGAATCTGADPCKACRDCTLCKYCNSGPGSCGVIRNQSPAEAAARLRKIVARKR